MLKHFEHDERVMRARGEFLTGAFLDGLAHDEEGHAGKAGNHQDHGEQKLGPQAEIGEHSCHFV